MRLCANCKTEKATLRRGTEFFCTDCYNLEHEPPLVRVARWDEVINPAYILALEERIVRLEKLIAEWTGDR